MEPLYNGHDRNPKIILYIEVSVIQKLSNRVMYYCGMKMSVVNREVSFIQTVLNREIPLKYNFLLLYSMHCVVHHFAVWLCLTICIVCESVCIVCVHVCVCAHVPVCIE